MFEEYLKSIVGCNWSINGRLDDIVFVFLTYWQKACFKHYHEIKTYTTEAPSCGHTVFRYMKTHELNKKFLGKLNIKISKAIHKFYMRKLTHASTTALCLLSTAEWIIEIESSTLELEKKNISFSCMELMKTCNTCWIPLLFKLIYLFNDKNEISWHKTTTAATIRTIITTITITAIFIIY